MSDLPPNAFRAGTPVSLTPALRPEVVSWFKVYAAAMALLYALVLLFAAAVILMGVFAEDIDPVEMAFLGVIMGGLGFVLMVAFAAALFLPQRPWVWVYDLVLIAIGLTSCVTMIATIPLLIYWIKPETRAWFGRA